MSEDLQKSEIGEIEFKNQMPTELAGSKKILHLSVNTAPDSQGESMTTTAISLLTLFVYVIIVNRNDFKTASTIPKIRQHAWS